MNWSKVLKKNLAINESSTEASFLGEFFDGLSSPCLLIPANDSLGKPQSVYFHLSNQLGTNLIDLSLGGTNKYGQTEERSEWQNFDLKVIESYIPALFDSLNSGLKPFLKKNIILAQVPIQTNSQLIKSANLKEIVFLLDWEVNVDGISGKFCLCLGSGFFG
ncbi:MAG: hypothetical protein HN509_05800 [Halobacteriovoraceae bacterium]|nr:hypothetical protein [Halobacteriovoraceae bacterium]MBT5095845.1 hypothetical protein [Halobacteriovoraceae bacterium]